MQNENKKFNDAVAFLKSSNLNNYLIIDSVEQYNFIQDQYSYFYSKSNIYKSTKEHWVFIFFDGLNHANSAFSDSIKIDYKRYFEPTIVPATFYIK